jgi:hypothetical protein
MFLRTSWVRCLPRSLHDVVLGGWGREGGGSGLSRAGGSGSVVEESLRAEVEELKEKLKSECAERTKSVRSLSLMKPLHSPPRRSSVMPSTRASRP